MASFLRWLGIGAIAGLVACGSDDLPADGAGGEGQDAAVAPGDGDGDGDDADRTFSLADGAVPSARPDAGGGDGDGTGASGTDIPDAVTGDGWLRFEEVAPGEGGGLRLPIRVPEGADAMVVTVDGRGAPRSLALIEIADPRGELLYDFRDEETGFPYRPILRRNVNDHLPYSFMLPNEPGLPLRSGEYSVLLYTDDPEATVDVDVVFQTLPSADAQPRLGVVLWFAAGAAVNATMASGDPDLGDAVDIMVAIFRERGLRVDSVDYRDLESDPSLASVEGDAELAALVGELRGDPGQVLHFIFVDHLQNGAGQGLRARSTGIPGVPAHPQLARRGAVVFPLDALVASISRNGEALAHEAAHYLGLAHTTEADGGAHDPIADTPECPVELATEELPSGGRILSAEDCAGHDGTNLMFYGPPRTAMEQRELTDGQVVMLVANPLVRWVEL